MSIKDTKYPEHYLIGEIGALLTMSEPAEDRLRRIANAIKAYDADRLERDQKLREVLAK